MVNDNLNEETIKILKSINKIPAFPAVTTKIIEMIEEDNYNVKELCEIIQLDPSISSRCLKLCNSSFFGLRRKIESVQQAIIIIGQNNILKIVMVASIGNIDFKIKGLWIHSISVAILTQIIFEIVLKNKNIKHELSINDDLVLYTIGLLHDIGKVISNQFLDKDYEKVEILNTKGVFNYIDIENTLLGMNHCQIGGKILKTWNFTDNFIDPIKNHHNAFKSLTDSINKSHILNLSDIIYWQISWSKNSSQVKINKDILNMFNLKNNDLKRIKFELLKKLNDAGALLNLNKELY